MRTVKVSFTDGDFVSYTAAQIAYSVQDGGEVHVSWTADGGKRGKATIARGAWKSVTQTEGDPPAAAPPA